MYGFSADNVGLDRRGGPWDKNWHKHVLCPICDREVPVDDYDHRHDMCLDCLDEKAEEFTQKFQNKINQL